MLNHKRIILLILIVFFGIALFVDWQGRKIEEEKNQERISTYLSEDKSDKETNDIDDQIIGVLSIDAINLKRGFYAVDSPLNDLNKNIQVIEDNMDQMLILAAHRGNSKVSFFQNLDKLSLGDEIYLNYKHSIYKYRLYYKYYENKDGNLSIKYDNTKNVLVLITCVKELKDKQVVYIAYKI